MQREPALQAVARVVVPRHPLAQAAISLLADSGTRLLLPIKVGDLAKGPFLTSGCRAAICSLPPGEIPCFWTQRTTHSMQFASVLATRTAAICNEGSSLIVCKEGRMLGSLASYSFHSAWPLFLVNREGDRTDRERETDRRLTSAICRMRGAIAKGNNIIADETNSMCRRVGCVLDRTRAKSNETVSSSDRAFNCVTLQKMEGGD